MGASDLKVLRHAAKRRDAICGWAEANEPLLASEKGSVAFTWDMDTFSIEVRLSTTDKLRARLTEHEDRGIT